MSFNGVKYHLAFPDPILVEVTNSCPSTIHALETQKMLKLLKELT